MEITFGEKLKINDEEVPEYLVSAIYAWYKDKHAIVCNKITAGVVNASRIIASQSHTPDKT
ncbi:hypothetical protein [Mannheimia indoligenes]|uniref:hypothetical protein n=1 Tax=Mannheimia indoligenes TaxID=3103145 RepID=UPI002FE5AA94